MVKTTCLNFNSIQVYIVNLLVGFAVNYAMHQDNIFSIQLYKI